MIDQGSESEGTELGCCVSLEQIKFVVNSGFDFIELQTAALSPELDDFALESVRELLLREALPVKSFNAFLPAHLSIVGEHVNRQRYERYVLKSMQRMSALGGQRVSFGSGASRSCPQGFPPEKAKQQILEFLEFTAKVAEDFGIQVNVEALNRLECNIINTLSQAEEYVSVLNLDNLGLIADFYHMQMEEEPINDLLQVKGSLNYVHVADQNRYYPGSGNYPFTNLFELLRQSDYHGPVSVECIWRDPAREIPAAAQFLKSYLK